MDLYFFINKINNNIKLLNKLEKNLEKFDLFFINLFSKSFNVKNFCINFKKEIEDEKNFELFCNLFHYYNFFCHKCHNYDTIIFPCFCIDYTMFCKEIFHKILNKIYMTN